MHLVSDPDKFDEAVRRNFPFFRTACGSAVPNKMLTKDPTRVDCVLCRKLIEQMMPPTPHPSQAVSSVPIEDPGMPNVAPPSNFELDDDLYDDLDDSLSGGPSTDLHPPSGLSPDKESSSSDEDDGGDGDASPLMGMLGNLDQVAEMVGMVMPMLGMVVGDCEVDPDWVKWVDEDHADTPFAVGSVDDIRALMPASDLEAIRTLYGFGKDFGLDPLFGLLLSILHRQVVARAAALETSKDEQIEEVDENDPPEDTLRSPI